MLFLAQNRHEEAIVVLKQLARGNGRMISSKLLVVARSSSPGRGRAARQEGVTDLFKKRKLVVITLIQAFSWFVNSGSYYGLTLAASNLISYLFILEISRARL